MLWESFRADYVNLKDSQKIGDPYLQKMAGNFSTLSVAVWRTSLNLTQFAQVDSHKLGEPIKINISFPLPSESWRLTFLTLAAHSSNQPLPTYALQTGTTISSVYSTSTKRPDTLVWWDMLKTSLPPEQCYGSLLLLHKVAREIAHESILRVYFVIRYYSSRTSLPL